MSSYSFSHQFYQRWTQAPDQVRAAIVQELTDITSLLQTETPFEEFVFTTHDLDAHLDELYNAHDAQKKAEKELAEKQAAERAAAEKQRLAEEKKAAEQKARDLAEAERIEAKRQAEKKQQENADKRAAQEKSTQAENAQAKNAQKEQIPQKSATASQADENSAADLTAATDNEDKGSITKIKKAEASGPSETTIVKPKRGAAIDLSLQDARLSAEHKDLISELEMHVDDYLSEQMMQMSEDLKSWLRAEVGRQLAELAKNEAPTDNSKK